MPLTLLPLSESEMVKFTEPVKAQLHDHNSCWTWQWKCSCTLICRLNYVLHRGQCSCGRLFSINRTSGFVKQTLFIVEKYTVPENMMFVEIVGVLN